MRNLIGRILCMAKGHKRGKKVATSSAANCAGVRHTYECPRCGAQWARKAVK